MTNGAWDDLWDALWEAAKDAVVAIGEAADALATSLRSVTDCVETALFSVAYKYAEMAYPKYVAIYRRTKKARIRKKYHDKIIRAYLEDT